MKNIIIAIVLILVIPALILFGLYQFVTPFHDMVNDIMRTAPGPIGDYFNSMPTSAETEAQLGKIAAYILELEPDRAVDKLSVIRAEDRAIYDSLIKAMIRLEPNRTEDLIDALRNNSLREDVVLDTLQAISDEQTEYLKSRADYLASLTTLSALREVQNTLDDEVDAHRTVASIFEHLSDSKVVAITGQLYASDVDKIYGFMPSERVLDLKSLVEKNKLVTDALSQEAQILKAKDAKSLAQTIGNTNNYSIDQLVDIYQTIGPKRAGEVLAQVEDDVFVSDLTKAIVNRQLLDNGYDNFSEDMIKSLNIYSEYDDNLNELVAIYEKVEESKTAEMIKSLYWNSENVKNYTLSNGDSITITDAQLAMDLLRSFSAKKIASILSYLDNSISTEISTKLALPDLE